MFDDEAVNRAVGVLRSGGLIGLPTETVYGLAADAENELAVRRIFAVKGRPESHPLIVHLAEVEAATQGWVHTLPPGAVALARAFWPGPLTIVMKRGPRALDVVTGGQDTVAIRVPAHPIARALLREFGGGLAAPSANRFGRVSPTRAEHVRADLGDDVDLVLDGGPSDVGVESTIVDLSGGAPALLRPGGISAEALAKVLGQQVPRRLSGDIRAPGMLAAHYAPRAGVLLVPESALAERARALSSEGRKVAALAATEVEIGVATRIEVPADAAGLARVLYAKFREVDAGGFDVVLVPLPREEGVGIAVLDRLSRAAASHG
jgi:L-threonylcarbamoyladenylate synthase